MTSVYLRLFDASVKLELSLWATAESATVAACGLKLGSVEALRVISARGDSARVQDLAADLGITIGAVSKIVDRLEAAGLVKRQPHATDGRSHVIGLTSRGRKACDMAILAMDAALQQRLQELASETALRRLVARLSNLAEA